MPKEKTEKTGKEEKLEKPVIAETMAKEAARAAESVYTAEELAENANIFGTYREIVTVAMRLAGKKTATLTEAKKIVEAFKNKEVK